MKIETITALLFVALVVGFNSNDINQAENKNDATKALTTVSYPINNSKLSEKERVEDLLSRLTLFEK